jgi:hypothetical protein
MKENGGLVGILHARDLLVWLACVAVISFSLMSLSFLPAEMFADNVPPLRAQLVTQLVMCTGVALSGFLLGSKAGQLVGPGWSRIALVGLSLMVGILLVFGPLAETRNTIIYAQLLRENAIVWNARDTRLREAAANGERQVEVPFTRDIGHLGELRAEPDFWINLDAAEFYGLESIKATGYQPPPIE